MADWRDKAACRNADPNLFFPEGDLFKTQEALEICRGCTVRAECLEDTPPDDKYSIRAGLTPWHRARLRGKEQVA